MNKRQSQINWYKRELDSANETKLEVQRLWESTRNKPLGNNAKVAALMLDSIDALIKKLQENYDALMSNDKVYLQENCHSDTRTLYAPVECQRSKHCHCTEDLIATDYGLICPDCYQELFDENAID